MPRALPVDPIAVELACYGEPVRLVPRERRIAVAHLTAHGYSGRVIAELLGITRRTVCRHRAWIREGGEAA